MTFLIAVVIIAVLSVFSLKLRAYMCWFLTTIGFCMLVADQFRPEDIYKWGGIVCLLCGLGILFLTSLKIEKSRRVHYMVHLYLCGMFGCVKMILFATIIFIGIGKIMSELEKQERRYVTEDGTVVRESETFVAGDGNRYVRR